MLIDDIFKNVACRLYGGTLFHEQLIQAFNFLCLEGYKANQLEHYNEEVEGFHRLLNYYMAHYDKLIPLDNVPDIKVLPAEWFNHTRFEVTPYEKRTALSNIYKEWLNWETETKQLLEKSYQDLIELKEVAAANEIKYFLENVDIELAGLKEKYLKLEAINYDLVFIIDEQ